MNLLLQSGGSLKVSTEKPARTTKGGSLPGSAAATCHTAFAVEHLQTAATCVNDLLSDGPRLTFGDKVIALPT